MHRWIQTAMGFAVVGLLAGAACDSPPAKQTAVTPPKTGPAGGDSSDKDALKELAAKGASKSNSESRGMIQSTGPGGLPSSHPPIGGASGADTSASSGLPKGHPPIPAGGGRAMAPASAAPAAVLKYDTPATWVTQTPTSNLRKAQFGLPKAEGDSADGQLIVYYFGPNEGGGVQANLDRWKGMFKTAGGEPVPDADVVVDKFEASGMAVTLMDISGRYADGTMTPGQAATPTAEEYRMFAAVVETPDGPWFFKAVGPQATMAANREAMLGMLKSARGK